MRPATKFDIPVVPSAPNKLGKLFVQVKKCSKEQLQGKTPHLNSSSPVMKAYVYAISEM